MSGRTGKWEETPQQATFSLLTAPPQGKVMEENKQTETDPLIPGVANDSGPTSEIILLGALN